MSNPRGILIACCATPVNGLRILPPDKVQTLPSVSSTVRTFCGTTIAIDKSLKSLPVKLISTASNAIAPDTTGAQYGTLFGSYICGQVIAALLVSSLAQRYPPRLYMLCKRKSSPVPNNPFIKRERAAYTSAVESIRRPPNGCTIAAGPLIEKLRPTLNSCGGMPWLRKSTTTVLLYARSK